MKLRNTNSWLRLSRFAKNKTKKTDIKKTVIKKEKKINKQIYHCNNTLHNKPAMKYVMCEIGPLH